MGRRRERERERGREKGGEDDNNSLFRSPLCTGGREGMLNNVKDRALKVLLSSPLSSPLSPLLSSLLLSYDFCRH